MAEFDLRVQSVAGGPVRAVSASGLELSDLPALRLPPVDRDWLVVTFIESPELFDRTLADLCRVAGIEGGPIAGTPYFAVAPGGAVRLFATRAVTSAYHAALLFAPQRPPAAALERLGIEPAEHWSPPRLGDGLYVECWDRMVMLYAESPALLRAIVNGVIRLRTGIEADHVAGLRIDLAAHAARYAFEEGPGGPQLARLPADAPAGALPELFVATAEGWALEPVPEPSAARSPAHLLAVRRRGFGWRLRRLLEGLVGYPVIVLVRAALLPPSAARRVRRLFR
jgi:hypothetical protein